MLILIHKQSCPYCGKVRDYMAENNIEYVSVPSESDSPSRKILEKMGGKQQVPFLLDFDKGEMMYESNDIIEYLKDNYEK